MIRSQSSSEFDTEYHQVSELYSKFIQIKQNFVGLREKLCGSLCDLNKYLRHNFCNKIFIFSVNLKQIKSQ